MKKVFSVVLLGLFAATFAACGSSGSSSSSSTTALRSLASCTAQAGTAVICGTVYAADGATPITGATIARVTASGSESLKGLMDGASALTASDTACTTDDVGQFACQVDGCSGSTTFQASGGLISTALQFTASCNAGEVTQVPTSSTTIGQQQSAGVKWLVVQGSFDGIQLLLSQLKGCTLTGDSASPYALSSSAECEAAGLTVISEADAATTLSTGTLSTYQAIFANCDADLGSDDAVTAKLQSYVSGGGNMYFSDLSDAWLTVVFPSLITFPAGKNATDSGTLSAVTVKDTGLQSYLGKATMEIQFDFGVWTAMQSVATGWTTYIEGDISSLAPTLTGTRPITVGGPSGNGCIFYTSYHVEGGGSGTDQEKALKYLVLNRMSNCS